MTEQGLQAHDFSRGSRVFPLPGSYATRMAVSPSCDDVSVGGAPLEVVRRYVENQKRGA
jgi:hypothetical protein